MPSSTFSAVEDGERRASLSNSSTPLFTSEEGNASYFTYLREKMNIRRNVMLAIVGSGLAIIIFVIIGVAVNLPSRPKACASSHPLLILVSFDGFRASYLSRGITPTIQRMVEEGVSVPYMNPSYPTITFPNHYTIVTGLYPESHGIIANSFYDPEFNDDFYLSSNKTRDKKWWDGEPIWNTLTKEKKISCTYFWPGSDAPINGTFPTYYVPYDKSIPFETRVDQVLNWIDSVDPDFITLYFSEPDSAGHNFGPDSKEAMDAIIRVDDMLKRLMDGLSSRNILDCTNIIVVADHGMAGGGPSWVIDLNEFIPNITSDATVYSGAFPRINPIDKDEEVKLSMQEALSCKRPDLRQFQREELPTRFHFSNNRRIEDIVLDLDPGRSVSSTSKFLLGNHGYDNYYNSMHALFTARGPSFKVGYEAEPFTNIELYNLLCHLTGVDPAPNNGTQGSLNSLLVNSAPITPLPVESKPSVPVYPPEVEVIDRLDIAQCNGDLNDYEDWLDNLDVSAEDQELLELEHLPWGIPHMGERISKDVLLLHHPDHVTGYSESMKMPLWTSFTVSTAFESSRDDAWNSDVRLDESNTAKCSDYKTYISANNDTILAPLFPPVFSSNSTLSKIPFLISNAVLTTDHQQDRWTELMETLVERWLAYAELNIITGPVFDSNADSLPDNFTEIVTPVLPSHWFAVMTMCESGGPINECLPASLETRAFIYPTAYSVGNCLAAEHYALDYSSTVRDVSVVTGFTFYPALTSEERIKLELTMHASLW